MPSNTLLARLALRLISMLMALVSLLGAGVVAIALAQIYLLATGQISPGHTPDGEASTPTATVAVITLGVGLLLSLAGWWSNKAARIRLERLQRGAGPTDSKA